jgi:hypothetical protein
LARRPERILDMPPAARLKARVTTKWRPAPGLRWRRRGGDDPLRYVGAIRRLSLVQARDYRKRPRPEVTAGGLSRAVRRHSSGAKARHAGNPQPPELRVPAAATGNCLSAAFEAPELSLCELLEDCEFLRSTSRRTAIQPPGCSLTIRAVAERPRLALPGPSETRIGGAYVRLVRQLDGLGKRSSCRRCQNALRATQLRVAISISGPLRAAADIAAPAFLALQNFDAHRKGKRPLSTLTEHLGRKITAGCQTARPRPGS